ncbi:MAG: hypothetical protein KDB21_02330 [Acidimicrobiales bacterium]|nr:hypothetical protein [Acidimicrobiales bacterium]
MSGNELDFHAPGPGVWEFDRAHQLRPATRLGAEILSPTIAEGMRSCFERYGLPLSHFDAVFVHGWCYLTPRVFGAPESAGGPPPAIVLKALTRLVPKMRRRWRSALDAEREQRWLTDAATWEAERSWWIDRNLEFQDVDLAAASDAELAAHVEQVVRHAEHGMRRHFELLGPAVGVGLLLDAADRWGLVPRDVLDLLDGHSPASGQTPTLGRLADALAEAGVRPATLDGVRAASPEAADALDAHLRLHGWWTTTDDIDGQPLSASPTIVLRSILAALDRRAEPGQVHAHQDVRSRVPATDRSRFDELLAGARRCYATLDDNSGLTASWPYGLVGRALREAADRLCRRGLADAGEAVWTMSGDEVVSLILGAAGPTSAELAERVDDRRHAASVMPPSHLGGTPSPPPDPSVFPGAAARVTAAFMQFLGAKFGEPGAVTAVGAEPARGRAVVALDAADALERLEPGDVLVTTFTTPAYNAILPIAAAVVTTTGGPLCHTAVVARELGLPAVVGMADAVDRIPDGALVEVDPVSVRVSVLPGP